jgi:hypothetical protein
MFVYLSTRLELHSADVEYPGNYVLSFTPVFCANNRSTVHLFDPNLLIFAHVQPNPKATGCITLLEEDVG